LTTGRIAAAHGLFNSIRQVALVCTPTQYMAPWANLSAQQKRHLDQFSCFHRAHYCSRPTDHASRSVTIGRIYVRSTMMLPNNNINSTNVSGTVVTSSSQNTASTVAIVIPSQNSTNPKVGRSDAFKTRNHQQESMPLKTDFHARN